MFNLQSTEKLKNLLYQILSIIILVGIICIFIIYILPIKAKDIYGADDKYYVFVPQSINHNTDTLKQGNLFKHLRFNGVVMRESNIIKQVSINKSKSLNCVVGSIITNHEDISSENDTNNYHKGRVKEITEEGDNLIISIDLATNYYAKFKIPDSYNYIIQDVITGNLVTLIQNNYNFLDFNIDEINYDKVSCSYLLSFQLNSIDDYTYPNSIIRAKIREKSYLSVIYLDSHIIKLITQDYNVILDRFYADMGKVYVEEIKIPIIDVVDNKLIVDGSSYLGDEFIIYDKYFGVNFK